MANWQLSSWRELCGKHFEFNARLKRAKGTQAEFFRREIKAMRAELEHRHRANDYR